MIKKALLCLAILFSVSIGVQYTLAQAPEAIDALNFMGTQTDLSDAFVGEDAGGVFAGIMRTFLPLANLVAVIILIITGLLMVISQDENQLSIARKTVIAVAAALVLINTAGPISIALDEGFREGEGGLEGASTLSTELLGFIEFIEVPIAALAVVMIIISGIRAIATFGTDQGTTHIRRTVFSVIIGIVIISSKVALTVAIGGADPFEAFNGNAPDSAPLVGVILNMVRIVLSFTALAAVVVIIIAAITLIVNKGDQEVAEKARSLIIRTLIGLFVILISAGLTMIVLG